ncbi:hypothetical protein [Metapseudomonas resinovorans]|uniref:Uncharacterized protein n=1 Tax=Metapseudomonas resinovorans NBRC 106553 TaxID=1245471 RepID=S6AVY8_METRE|nr:hypothetical protein [Pseudomonas resinovorans]BAN48671.1 hypothetical protein PCA10_29390 [Pseudomonas resinovorans NBRC 106553]
MGFLLLCRLLRLLIPSLLLAAALGTIATRLMAPLDGMDRHYLDQAQVIRQVAIGYDPRLVHAMASNWCWRF